MSDNTSGRTILSFLVAAIAIFRLIYTCSDMNNRHSDISSPYNQQFKEQMESSQAIMEQSINNARLQRKAISNTILYTSYVGLDSLSAMLKDDYGLLKLEKDSSIYVDIKTQVKIPKDYYYQNNHDDSLRVAFKSPDNLNIFIHDFDTADDVEKSFKGLKGQDNLQKFKVENKIDNAKVISYKVLKNNKRFNGYAMCFQTKTNDHLTTFEFESTKLSKAELKIKSIEFLLKNMKQQK